MLQELEGPIAFPPELSEWSGWNSLHGQATRVIFKTGVVCNFVKFQDDHRTTRALWYFSVHEETKEIVKALGTGKAVRDYGKWIRAYHDLHVAVKAVLSR